MILIVNIFGAWFNNDSAQQGVQFPVVVLTRLASLQMSRSWSTMVSVFAVSMAKPVCLGIVLLKFLGAPSFLEFISNLSTPDLVQLSVCSLPLRCTEKLCASMASVAVHGHKTEFSYTVQVALIANFRQSRHTRRCRSVALTMTSLSHCQFSEQVLAASRGLNRTLSPTVSRNRFRFQHSNLLLLWKLNVTT